VLRALRVVAFGRIDVRLARRAGRLRVAVVRVVRIRVLGLSGLLVAGGAWNVGALLVLGLGRLRVVRIVGRLLLRPGGTRGEQSGETKRTEESGHLMSPVKSAAKLATQRPDRTFPALPHLHAEGACDYVAACPTPRRFSKPAGCRRSFAGSSR